MPRKQRKNIDFLRQIHHTFAMTDETTLVTYVDNKTNVKRLPYNPISQFYRQQFGEKVHKISVAVAETCPNREGLRGMRTCNFCDQWGSAAYHENLEKPLRVQIEELISLVGKKRSAQKFLVYFQAYTTTFSKVAKLKEQVAEALEFKDVVGVVIGTRPDCLSDSLLEFFGELSEKTFLAVEMGVQSFDEQQLLWMARGHTAELSRRALRKIAERAPKLNLGLHLIFGLPNETDEDVMKAAVECNQLPIHNVKIHHLHVLKNTELEGIYAKGEFTPIDRETYFQRCKVFLQHLNPKTHVHRLAAYAPRYDELIAPEWTKRKMESYQEMLNFMESARAFQGQLYSGEAQSLSE